MSTASDRAKKWQERVDRLEAEKARLIEEGNKQSRLLQKHSTQPRRSPRNLNISLYRLHRALFITQSR